MRHLFRIAALAASLLFLAACEEDETPAREIEVTPAYLNGTWILAEWNGVPLADGLYLYVTFNRRESTYEMYYNFDSMYARLVTGSFNVEEDKELGYVISGDYDYENGDWTREYVVSDRLEDAMTWTAKDDAGDVHRFVRCEKVPDEIVEEAKSDTKADAVKLSVIF